MCAPNPGDRQTIIPEKNDKSQVIEQATVEDTEGKGPDADRLIPLLHECWKPRVFDSVTGAELSEVFAKATLRSTRYGR